MELSITLGLAAWIVVIAASLVFGGIAQELGETRTGYEWLADAVAFGIGAIAVSEIVIALRTIEPVLDGLAVVPALVGGLIVGIVVELVTRFSTGGTYTSHVRMSA
jgi:uncharacterized membrane protein YeaQ/YmgE (transglycosylase-associated protein family)